MGYKSVLCLIQMLLILIGIGISVNKTSKPMAISGNSVWAIVFMGFFPFLINNIFRITYLGLSIPDLLTTFLMIVALIVLRFYVKGIVVFGLSKESSNSLLKKLKSLDEQNDIWCTQKQMCPPTIRTCDVLQCSVISGNKLFQKQQIQYLKDTFEQIEGNAKLSTNYFLLIFALFLVWIALFLGNAGQCFLI